MLTHLSTGNPSFCHDVKLVQKNLNNMFVEIQPNNITKLCGDKGYISKNKFKLNNNKRVGLITQKKEKSNNTKYKKRIKNY